MALSGSLNTSSYDGRYYQLSWSATQNITNNTSTVSWTLKAVGGSASWYAERTVKVVLAGATVYSKTDRVERYTGNVASGSKVITHDSSGAASFSVSVQAAVYGSSVNCTGSNTFTLDVIPRKSTMSVGNGTLGTSQTITINRLSTSFTHSIKAVCGNSTVYIKADGSTSSSEVKHNDDSIPFTPLLDWANQNTTGTSVNVTYTLTTYNGSTSIGNNTYTKTYSMPSSVKPSVTLSVSEASSIPFSRYVQNVSKLKITLTAKTSYGSAISSYKTTVNGTAYANSSFTTSVLTSSGNLTISTTVTDKRGRTGTASTTINVMPYSSPKFSYMKVHRCNEDGTENIRGEWGKVSFEASCNPLLDGSTYRNNISFLVEYKKTSDLKYTQCENISFGTIQTGNTGVIESKFKADPGTSYHVRITVIDIFNSTPVTTVLSTAFSLIHFLSNGLGIAFGKLSELSDVLDIGFKTRFMGGILHPVLEANTDLNTVVTPNTYVGANIATYKYTNTPAGLTTGTFSLEVVGVGPEGQVKQRITFCHKTEARIWERIYYQSSWGEWVCVSDFDGQLLWSGAYFMTTTHIATLSETVSRQKNGIVLVFSEYANSASVNQSFHTIFVPKYMVSKYPGVSHCIQLSTSNFAIFATKLLYISDDKITGHADNDKTGTGTSGPKYTNNRFVLRYVIGV